MDTGWPCPTCTLINSSSITVCSACGAKKDSAGDEQNPPSSPGAANPGRTFKRQKSIPVESRRKRDEKQAKEQWADIVKYCKNVRATCASDTCPFYQQIMSATCSSEKVSIWDQSVTIGNWCTCRLDWNLLYYIQIAQVPCKLYCIELNVLCSILNSLQFHTENNLIKYIKFIYILRLLFFTTDKKSY